MGVATAVVDYQYDRSWDRGVVAAKEMHHLLRLSIFSYTQVIRCQALHDVALAINYQNVASNKVRLDSNYVVFAGVLNVLRRTSGLN